MGNVDISIRGDMAVIESVVEIPEIKVEDVSYTVRYRREQYYGRVYPQCPYADLDTLDRVKDFICTKSIETFPTIVWCGCMNRQNCYMHYERKDDFMV